ncbi:craniofacial development protein 2-like [Dysidea avara]|uniref:craniofacial development protein 2-like n=1 Tax=Dysidea avara TaxID=196820 RepID=UPI003329CB57
MGSWNIRLLVESESSVVTVSTRRGVQVDRKVNLLVGELCCFDLSITGISETKWFGQGVYEVDGFVLVHYSGRPTPADGELVQRNEGVGILLNPVMAVAWRDSIDYKDQFYDDLMCTINSVCQDDLLLVVGYFNARVESNYSKPGSVEWSGVRGNHSVGKANEAGRAPLTFCVVNGLTVMNTCDVNI